MSDYIKREDAIKALERWHISGVLLLAPVPSADVVERSSYESMEHTVAKLNEALSNSVEVVRCKDCKYHAEFSSKCNKLNLTPMWPNDYCSFGERKDEGL